MKYILSVLILGITLTSYFGMAADVQSATLLDSASGKLKEIDVAGLPESVRMKILGAYSDLKLAREKIKLTYSSRKAGYELALVRTCPETKEHAKQEAFGNCYASGNSKCKFINFEVQEGFIYNNSYNCYVTATVQAE